jgi:redox-sensitive bicupin YhaK (pirin superfamily)
VCLRPIAQPGAGVIFAEPLVPEIRPMSIRPIVETRAAQPTMEGAGVHLHRAFGFQDPTELDPFLLFDDFRNDDPALYHQGFPWHPHRGIETITYVLEGSVEHADSLGNTGRLGAGSVQWMTAGSGILHQEMPLGNAKGQMHGFQLWGNLPGAQKMVAPRYQDIAGADIPEVTDDDGTHVRVITGEFWGRRGPVDGIAADPQYLDITVPAGLRKTFRIDTYRRAFAYVFQGAGAFAEASAPTGVLLEKEVMGREVNIRDLSGDRTLIRFGTGDEVIVQAGPEGVRFLLISGAPIEEPVAWHGPIVMNTQAEIRQAMQDLRNGTFIRPQH